VPVEYFVSYGGVGVEQTAAEGSTPATLIT